MERSLKENRWIYIGLIMYLLLSNVTLSKLIAIAMLVIFVIIIIIITKKKIFTNFID